MWLGSFTAGCGEAQNDNPHAPGQVDWDKLARISAPHGEGSRLTAMPTSVLVTALMQDVSRVSGLAARAPVAMMEVEAEEHLAFVDELAQRENSILPLQALYLGSEAVFDALGIGQRLAGDGQEEAALATSDASDDDRDADVEPTATSITQGYYDPAEKTFYIDSRLTPDQRMETIRHELMHVLQDQHFGLNRLLAETQFDLDKIMAYKAVVEGMAEVAATKAARVRDDHFLLLPACRKRVSYAATRRHLGASWTAPRPSSLRPLGVHFFDGTSRLGPTSLYAASPSLIDLVHFPYDAGARFFGLLLSSAAYRDMAFSDWVQESFLNLPQRTHDIYHPLEWASERGQPAPSPLSLHALQSVPDHTVRWESGLGEIIMRAYLFNQRHGSALAAGMTRDRVLVLDQPASTLPVVAWVTEWQDDGMAQVVASVAKSIQKDVWQQRRTRGVTPGPYAILQQNNRVGFLLEVARDNGHPRADQEHQRLLKEAMASALREP